MGVGGLFDFYSGRIKRAPRWMRDIGLEWVFRLLMEPKRMFRRYIIGNPLFLRRVKALKKCSLFIQKAIRKNMKKKSSQRLDILGNNFFVKSYCQLIDIMPQIFTFCNDNSVEICLHSQNQQTADMVQIAKSLFPQLSISDDLNSSDNFKLIIADHHAEKDHINSLYLHDPRFFEEFKRINLL